MRKIAPISVQELLGPFSLSIGGSLSASSLVIDSLASLREGSSSSLSFFEAGPAVSEQDLEKTVVGAVIMTAPHAAYRGLTLISPHPRLSFAQIATFLTAEPASVGGFIHPTAVIGSGVVLEEGVILEAYVVIGDRCHIGKNSRIGAHTVLYSDVSLGPGVRIHSGCVIGSDGFGFVPDKKGQWTKIPQLGGVRIGAGVDIGANTTIDRGTLEDTVIEEGVILDNQIQIAHNVHIGAYTAIAGCTGIAGSTRIGRHCLIGGGCCITGHIEIADHVHITGMSGVTHSIGQPGAYSSSLGARPQRQWARAVARLHRLDKTMEKMKALEAEWLLLKQSIEGESGA